MWFSLDIFSLLSLLDISSRHADICMGLQFEREVLAGGTIEPPVLVFTITLAKNR